MSSLMQEYVWYIYIIFKKLEARCYDNCNIDLLLPIEDNGKDSENIDFIKKNHYDELIFDVISKNKNTLID